MLKPSPGPYSVQPLASDHGASLAVVDKKANVLCIIPPISGDDWDSAKRYKHDEANAELFARSFVQQKALIAAEKLLVNMPQTAKNDKVLSQIAKALRS